VKRARAALALALAALPVRLVLALATDLSPDEAYYLCAARRPEAIPPMPDHPPLLPWMLRATDGLAAWPVELRVRIWPLLTATALGFICIELARRRGAGPRGQVSAAWIGSWALLPMAGGFVATPDGPALLAIGALLLWSAADRDRSMSRWGDFGAGLAALVGTAAKVVVAPVAALLSLPSSRPWLARVGVAGAAVLTLPLLLPSLRFQAHHALAAGSPPSWSLADAVGSAATAVVAQLALWSPWVLWLGGAALRGDAAPRGHRLLVAVFSLLVLTSAIVRGLPPEPNWWAPAALVVVVAAARPAEQLAPRLRMTMLATVVVPTWVVASHVLHPWLPLPTSADPTARLHGWKQGPEPLDAPGIGPYGPPAERCIYREDCTEINSIFDMMKPMM